MNVVKRNMANRVYPSIMDEMFKDLLGGTQYVHKAMPPVNIRETEQSFTVELMAAGMKKEDFSIEVDNELLTISGEVKAGNNEENGKFTRREFSPASFKRSFTLPETVKEEEIIAAYEEGILKLTLPKKEEALPKTKRLVEIS
ncbi:Hsp20/alpha crystallin family protein [uncultured Flavobacterium sp.]|uniref:Hsp20/alpha crystallin family protein n=1 Tax=uncultured Flavobacterium sp. TaxID=165435 RepID=UPI0025F582D7|nr:Hsp20/alpha crystallin family protein [uncultured Flavobacterium sp.]